MAVYASVEGEQTQSMLEGTNAPKQQSVLSGLVITLTPTLVCWAQGPPGPRAQHVSSTYACNKYPMQSEEANYPKLG